jgi:hypothetical protein
MLLGWLKKNLLNQRRNFKTQRYFESRLPKSAGNIHLVGIRTDVKKAIKMAFGVL